MGKYKWPLINNELTDEIAFRFSVKLNRIARKNMNRVQPEMKNEIENQMLVSRVNS